MAADPRFGRGDRVRLLADAARVGLIDGDAVEYTGGWTYPVFFGGNDNPLVAESSLELVPREPQVAVLSREAFLRALLLAKLDSPLTDTLYSYQASRTTYEPYQFKPVFKYLDAPVNGILIADEVGLGKTIEAAILMEELKARQGLARVLIVCPAGLCAKWRAELLNRFDENFRVLRRVDLLEDFALYHETDGRQPLQGITGLETIRGRNIQEALAERPVRFDMVIIDEAHHLRTAGRLSNLIGERLSDLTDNLVLLTATPLQTSQQDLFNLLRFIDETQFREFGDFMLQLQPNALLNQAIRDLSNDPPDPRAARAALDRINGLGAGGQVTSHPNYGPVMDALETGSVDRPAAIRLSRQIDQMNVISSVYTRTRKRDVAGVAKREAHVFHVAITEPERQFYQAVLDHARAEAAKRSSSGWIPGFVGMMRERQAASCMAATREYLTELYRTSSAQVRIEDSSTDVEPEDFDNRPEHERRDALTALLQAASELGEVDSKFTMFVSGLRAALQESTDSKVIVFSFFRRTLSYLDRELRRLGFDVIQINGSVPPEDRAMRIDSFKSNPKIQVLLTSEVGAEGLDFQFCDTLFNYDLPWNPMRVEQRIGRIDRYGQKRDKIRIYSFFLEGTIEERILERLYERIGIFEDSIGDLEPILGPLATQLTREIFAADLTPDEEVAIAVRYGDQVVHRREDERRIEARSAELMGQDELILQAVEETVTAGRYVSKAELRAIVDGYLKDVSSSAGLEDKVGDGTATLRVDSRVAAAVSDQVQRDRDSRPGTTAFLAKIHRAVGVPVTFDGETAMASRRLELLNLRHPLVRTAIAHYRALPRSSRPVASLVVDSTEIDLIEGEYYFALFILSVRSAQEQTRILPIVVGSDGHRERPLEERLLWLLQERAADAQASYWSTGERERVFLATTPYAAEEADAIETEARDRNDGLISVREATLRRTIGSKIAKRRQQISDATNERIQMLWRGEIRNLEADLKRRVAELETKRAVSVTYQPIAGGHIRILSTPDPTVGVAVSESPVALESLPVAPYPEPPTSWWPPT